MESGTGAEHAEQVYLSDVEPNPVGPLVHAADLRSRVLLHVLLADVLLVGDSQSLNNRYFRCLVSKRERGPGPDAPAPADAVLSDLAPLLREGRIRVARRAGSTLLDIREEHARQQVANVPGRSYVGLLDDLTSAHTVPYHLPDVAEAFRGGVLSRVDAALETAAGPARPALSDARRWVADQPRLLHIELRAWAADRSAQDRHRAGTVLALQALDDWALESYRCALPRALNAATARPREGQDLPSGAGRRLFAAETLPAVLLDPYLLSRVPVDVVLEAVAQPARTALVHQLALVRSGLRPDRSVMGEAVAEFGGRLLEAFERAFRPALGREWDHLRSLGRLMRFGLDEDPATGRLGAVLDIGAPAAGALHLSFAVTGSAEAATTAGRGPRPVAVADPRDRLVCA